MKNTFENKFFLQIVSTLPFYIENEEFKNI